MGLLEAGTPLTWTDSKTHASYVQEHGVQQFISIYNNNKNFVASPFLWGDEVEYFVANIDTDRTRSTLPPLRAPQLLRELQADPATNVADNEDGKGVVWHPEFANWMIEATPAFPYGGRPEELLEVENNMKLRRDILSRHLEDEEALVTLCVFPRLGAANFAGKDMQPTSDGDVSQSLYIPDAVIQPHPRFPTMTSNIRQRRGEKVLISVPIFQDEHTHRTVAAQAEQIQAQPCGARVLAALPADHIYMDATAFGFGASCLQVTMQASDVAHARELYDQLAVLAPIFLALTAASPVWKGMLADTDARWNVISAAVDDRTAGERGEEQPAGKEQRIHKSRYSSVDTYIADSAHNRREFNDVPVPVNSTAMALLREGGVDEVLATHVAHLFIRDPLVVYREKLEQDDETDNDHFENIQSTNWNTVRFKPPPPAAANPRAIRWRVEFRPMEVGMSDFENAAFAAVTVLLAQAATSQCLDLYMPISLVDVNMERAHLRGAAVSEKFHFRTSMAQESTAVESVPEVTELSLDQIMNGDAIVGVVGLLQYARRHLDGQECTGETRARLEQYLAFVGQRASGKLPTAAAWLRTLVLNHPAYARDSVVSDEICLDIVREAAAIGAMRGRVSELLGQFATAMPGEPGLAASVSGSDVRSSADTLQHSASVSSLSLELSDSDLSEGLAASERVRDGPTGPPTCDD